MFENIKKENQEIKQIIYFIAEKINEKKILNNENEHQGKKDKKDNKIKKDKKDSKENTENKENKDKKEQKEQKEQKEKNRFYQNILGRFKNKNVNTSNNNKSEINSFEPKMPKETNNNSINNKENKNNIEITNINFNVLEDIKYNILLEQIEYLYGNNISKENLLTILCKIKEIIKLVQMN